ncbi:MAG: hypothetical protein ABWZ25_17255 [Chitinophagaceae bacterium]
MSKKLCYSILQVFALAILSCNGISGEYSLGNHLSLWDNEKKEEKVIVYCEGDCYGGIYVVPSYERHYDSSKQHYAEYIDEVTFDKKWVLAKTVQMTENKENYYIINKGFNIENLDCAKANCDSILQSHVIGPLSITEFKNKLQVLSIGLDFK